MQKKQRFIVSFKDDSKEVFLALSQSALTGITDNPDFVSAPVTNKDFKDAYDAMVAAAPAAVRNNIDGLRAFKPLRTAVEGMMTKLGTFAQATIGDNPERMKASGLPLSKEPTARPDDINVEVVRPKLELGKVSGEINVSAKPNRAADGIVVEVRQPDMSFKEVARVSGFKTTINGFSPDEVVVVQIRYWNNAGVGPRLGRPLAIVV